MSADEARQLYETAARGESEESQEWAYLRWRFLAGDPEESVAAANSMRGQHGLPSANNGVTHHWRAILSSPATQRTQKAKARS